VIGGILGVAGSFAPGPTGKAAAPAHPGWWDFVCDGDSEYERYERLQANSSAAVAGPVSVDFTSVDNRTSEEIKSDKARSECWRPLPAGGGGAGFQSDDTRTEASGWFFRFMPDQSSSGPAHITTLPPLVYNQGASNPKLPPSVQTTVSFFQAAGSDSKPIAQNALPVSACRAIDLQLTWWEEFKENTNKPLHRVQFVTFPLTVADPTYVQKIAAPSHGSITLLPICGGYASSGGPSTDLNESISNLLKEAQAVKEAQSKWAAPAKK
jgi:hypothetical protein